MTSTASPRTPDWGRTILSQGACRVSGSSSRIEPIRPSRNGAAASASCSDTRVRGKVPSEGSDPKNIGPQPPTMAKPEKTSRPYAALPPGASSAAESVALASAQKPSSASRTDTSRFRDPLMPTKSPVSHLQDQPVNRARLFVFEGPDGVGKSTLANAFVETLRRANGTRCELIAFPGAEEGTLGLHVYNIHHHPERFGVPCMDATSRQVLHIAAHIDAIERRIMPALQAGVTVVLDRFWWSTWVYGLESGVSTDSLNAMLALEKIHWQKVTPNAIFLIRRRRPFLAEHNQVRFARLNARYSYLLESMDTRSVHILENSTSVAEEVSQLLHLANGSKMKSATIGVTTCAC